MARKRVVTLLAILGVLLVVLFWRSSSAPPLGGGGVPEQPSPAEVAAASRGATGSVPDVALERLEAPKRPLDEAERNPFTFGERLPPASPVVSAPEPDLPVAPDAEPPMPAAPSVPPIPLKFIGIVEGRGTSGKIAVLSDGRFVYHGQEGDLVEGRYRIVRIGEESLEMEHVDGRGRQVIRLSGS